MQSKIMRTGTFTGREFAARTTPTGPPRFDVDEVRRVREAAPVADLEMYNPPIVDPEATKHTSNYPVDIPK
jgi:hypothetical protein